MQGTIQLPDEELLPSIRQKWTLQRSLSGLTWLQFIALAIVSVMLLPLAYLFLRAAGAGEEGFAYLLEERTIEIMLNSLWMVIAVIAGATLLGVPFAFLTARTDLPFRRIWLVLGLLSMVIPSYLAAVTYLTAFGPVGYLQQFLEPFGVLRLPDIRGFWGAWFSMVLFTYPYIALTVRSALLHSDPALDEVGYSLGLNRYQVFWRITLPQLRPAITSGMLLAGMYALGDFGAVSIMRYNAFTRAIYLQINGFRMERAALLALVLVVFTLLLFMLDWKANQGNKHYRIGTGAKRNPKIIKLGLWKIPALLFCAALVFVGVIIPLGVMLDWALRGGGTDSPIDLNMSEMVMTTGGTSLVTAFFVALVALPLARLSSKSNSVFDRWLVALSYTGYVLPGIVMALALVYFAANYANPLYQTLPLLILGYGMRFLPYSIGATRNALLQINPRIQEAAQSLGMSRWQIVWRITLPLAKTGILAGAALVFLNTMKELPLTLILRPIGLETFPTRIWQFYNEAMLPLIGLPGMLLMLISALGLVLILWRDGHTKT
jgi:iron(III) transport system permease protein